MKSLVTLLLTVAFVFTAGSVVLMAADNDSLHGKPEPQAAGVHWARGNAPGHPGRAPVSKPELAWRPHHG